MVSYDFYTVTQRNLSSGNPGSFGSKVTMGYYLAMFTLNGLNYFWFSQMVAAITHPKAEHIKKKPV